MSGAIAQGFKEQRCAGVPLGVSLLTGWWRLVLRFLGLGYNCNCLQASSRQVSAGAVMQAYL